MIDTDLIKTLYKEILQESATDYKILYHIGISPPKPKPLRRFINHPANTNNVKDGVFLTDNPSALYKSIKDELVDKSKSYNNKYRRIMRYKKWGPNSFREPADSNILKIWAVRVPTSLIYKLGGIRNNPNIHSCREIIVPTEYWPNVKVTKTPKTIDNFIASNKTNRPIAQQYPRAYKYDPTRVLRRLISSNSSDTYLLIKSLDENKKVEIKKAADELLSKELIYIDYIKKRLYRRDDGDQLAFESTAKRIDKIKQIISLL